MRDGRSALGRDFVRRTWFQFGVAASLFVGWQLLDVFLLAFGAVIVAVLLRSVADPIRDRTPLNDSASLALAGLVILALLGAAGWLFGSTVSAQVAEFSDRMPRSREELQGLVSSLPLGDELAAQIPEADEIAAQVRGVAGRLSGYAVSLVGAATNFLLLLVAGIYFALKPRQGRDGLLMLLPADSQEPVKEAFDASGRALRLWLVGTLADMVVVGVLTGIGTALIGLPSPVALGLFAGLAAFVPIVGPIVSVVPGVLLAAQESPQMVLWTLLVYFGVQQLESNLVYPFIQRRAVGLPPVLTLFGVLGFGLLLGPMGVIFATPLLVVLMVLTKILYVRNSLGREVDVAGQKGVEPGAAGG